MGTSNGSLWGIGSEEQRSIYALVSYIPEPLGKFLDDLRLELMPGCTPHAHVSLLPPRPLDADWHVASEHARSLLELSEPFEVEFTRPAVFPVTGVIYLEVGEGQDQLQRLHRSLNAGAVAFDEPFPYHPHATLAQGVTPERAEELYPPLARLRRAAPLSRRPRRLRSKPQRQYLGRSGHSLDGPGPSEILRRFSASPH